MLDVMSTETHKPRRLLCTWHVIKNWNIQGKNKLEKMENKKEMKFQMRNILKEMDIEKFSQLKNDYFEHLDKDGENEFLKYLQKHYFQSEQQIKMWAHYYKKFAGINIIKAIESLDKVQKRSDCVSGPGAVDSDKPSTSTSYGNEVEDFIEATERNQEHDFSVDKDKRREIVHEKANLQLKSIDDENFYKITNMISKISNQQEIEHTKNNKKRKIESQSYFPRKK